MLHNKKIIVVLPAYNAEKTLEKTLSEIPKDLVDDILLTDDYSIDNTVELAKKLDIDYVLIHTENKGYGANQKTCYEKALELNADIIVMLHPDYQYAPKLIPSMCDLVSNGVYDLVLGSRILGEGALRGGMPIYKYIANRILTLIQNIMMGQKLSEYHTGYRCYNAYFLKQIPFQNNSNDFVFDNELIAQFCLKKAKIGEISCPTKYDKDSSSINFTRSVAYGFGVLWVSLKYLLHKNKIFSFSVFNF
ncbi:glycosyltransferase family 2 protein [Aestuariivivens sediminicola]|uniref:glycosyltransferase family 2 protein n=1 Tax=Aestuariivivens sediminicola TaxID=2913560 RepID=UPI001F57195F|nr:glycosyltransferase family 2 protein [Aestuariivivens sediminicola]